MGQTPLVSVATPCYNCEEYLPAFLRSLLGQTWRSLEVLLADDGSTDGTAEVIRGFEAEFAARGIPLSCVSLPHAGQAAALNAVLPAARGKYLVWPDADDILEPSSLEERVSFLETHPDYGLVRSDRYFIDAGTGARSEPGACPQPEDDRLFELLFTERLAVCSGCYMLRMEFFDRLCPGRAIEACPAGQNYQLLLPMARFYKCGYIDRRLYGVTLRSDSHSRRTRSYAQDMTRYNELLAVCSHILRDYCPGDVRCRRLLRIKRRRLYCDAAYSHGRTIRRLFCSLMLRVYKHLYPDISW